LWLPLRISQKEHRPLYSDIFGFSGGESVRITLLFH
jgi:hypothetical protein